MLGKNNMIQGGEFKSDMMVILNLLQKNNFQILSAHVIEEWGQRQRPPAAALEEALRGLLDADVILALSSGPPSLGVQLELGAALALGKPLVQIYRSSSSVSSYLNAAFKDDGFRRRRQVRVIEFDDRSHLYEQLENVLADLFRRY
jgi:nucleoside 2-deoxyribosyltransferase